MKTKTYLLMAFATFIALVTPIVFAGLNDASVAFKSGNWKVLRAIDPMKDTVDCTGIYKENYGIQLTSDTLYVSVKGGLRAVTLRFGDKPARSLRIAEKMEKEIRSVIISGTDFSELLENDRLRVQAGTLVAGIANEDLDLTGLKDALESIRAGCPMQAIATPSLNPDRPSVLVSDRPAQKVCSDVVVSRMKAQGLKEKEILAICK